MTNMGYALVEAGNMVPGMDGCMMLQTELDSEEHIEPTRVGIRLSNGKYTIVNTINFGELITESRDEY